MKGKLSATIEEPLIEFLDSLPGKTRSEKLERILEVFKRKEEERNLRRELARYREGDHERVERESWVRTTEEAMWNE